MNAIVKKVAVAVVLAAALGSAHAKPAVASLTSSVLAEGKFDQSFEFQTSANYNAAAAMIYASAQYPLISDLKIEIFEQGAAKPLFSVLAGLTGDTRKATFMDNQFAESLVANAHYKLLVSGYNSQAGSTFGVSGTYIGSLAAIPAVPEPDAYAMWLAGLGLMGGIAFRKSKNS